MNTEDKRKNSVCVCELICFNKIQHREIERAYKNTGHRGYDREKTKTEFYKLVMRTSTISSVSTNPYINNMICNL